MHDSDAQEQVQDEVFAFLADPATHGGAPVRRIDTHAAAVFLAQDHAYKVKRAVRFPFLDFSTLERRERACESELEVNQPFARDLYKRVTPITREADGRLAIGGQGKPVEWAVEMVRFDENATLDHMAGRGEIDDALADALARAVARAHAQAPPVAASPWLDALARFIAQNDEAFLAMPALFPRHETSALTQASRVAFERVRPLLVVRGQQGLVRRGHGDLHLGNIALIDGKPVPFDAIEFDPLIAAGDVLYDLAFLLMDLIERGLGGAANVVLNRYLAETQRDDDLDALVALPLFMSMRAAIRAKVTAARLAGAKAQASKTIAGTALTYFNLARALIDPPAPTLVAIGGLSGTGKSVLARALAPGLLPPPGAVLLRSDVERKLMAGVGETDRLPAAAYTAEATAKVYARLADKARRVIAAGHTALVDAVFAAPQERAAIVAAAAAHRVRFAGLFLVADLQQRIERVGTRRNDASDAGVDVAQRQESYEVGAMDWRIVDASGSPAATLAHAKTALAHAKTALAT
ncbi:MAG: AAA family ATPase [Alphaproteobacteria bacterium]|nr:AAA family ATPase [Alphaproteobacteria bacterium]